MKKWVILALILFLPLFFFWKQSQSKKEAHSSSKEAPKAPLEASEWRKGVRKDIFFTQGDLRRHFVIESDTSTLSYRAEKGKIEILEKMGKAKATFEDERGSYEILAKEVLYKPIDHTMTATEVEMISALERGVKVLSKKASFDGKTLTLKDDVTLLFHDGTKIIAETAFVDISTPEKKLFLRERVHLTFKEGGDLFASKADFDESSGVALFQGSHELPFVEYRGGGAGDFFIRAERVTAKGFDLLQKDMLSLQEIKAQGQVVIHFKDCLARGDVGLYEKTKEGLQISLFSEGEDKGCQLERANGDLIRAEKMVFSPAKMEFLCLKASGMIDATVGKGEKILFSCQELIYNDIEKTLRLKEDISLDASKLGLINCDKELIVKKGEGHTFSSLHASGKTSLQYEKKNWLLTCLGECSIDEEKKTILFSKASDSPEPVTFKDSSGFLYADTVRVSYRRDEGAVIPVGLDLRGDVRMHNKKGLYSQYALADFAEYYPQTEVAYLKAKKKHRVLLYDTIRQLKISAEAIEVKRDEMTNKEAIQGFGNVRFHFCEKELEEYKAKFNIGS